MRANDYLYPCAANARAVTHPSIAGRKAQACRLGRYGLYLKDMKLAPYAENFRENKSERPAMKNLLPVELYAVKQCRCNHWREHQPARKPGQEPSGFEQRRPCRH